MTESTRCLYNSNIETFLGKDREAILGILWRQAHWPAIGIKNMKNDTLTIVDFYFTNSLGEFSIS